MGASTRPRRVASQTSGSRRGLRVARAAARRWNRRACRPGRAPPPARGRSHGPCCRSRRGAAAERSHAAARHLSAGREHRSSRAPGPRSSRGLTFTIRRSSCAEPRLDSVRTWRRGRSTGAAALRQAQGSQGRAPHQTACRGRAQPTKAPEKVRRNRPAVAVGPSGTDAEPDSTTYAEADALARSNAATGGLCPGDRA